MKPVTVFDVALVRLKARAIEHDPERLCGDNFDAVGLPLFGGCQVCGASIAAYNACPTRTGYLRCASGCVDNLGFPSAKAFEAWEAYQQALREADEDDEADEADEADKDDEDAAPSALP